MNYAKLLKLDTLLEVTVSLKRDEAQHANTSATSARLDTLSELITRYEKWRWVLRNTPANGSLDQLDHMACALLENFRLLRFR